MKMIFIFIFVTISVTFCNSVFINRVSKTHLLVLSYQELDIFKGKWIDELPDEMIKQYSSICQLLIEPIIILDKTTFPRSDRHTIYWNFRKDEDSILPLKEHTDEPFWFEKNDHRIHLLPCHRNTRQTIYITKLVEYESYIMLANERYFPDTFEFRILGFIMKFAQLNSIGGNTLELLYDVFRYHIINEKKEKRNIYPIPTYYHHSSTLEYRIQSFRLCASVLRKLLIGIAMNSGIGLVQYVQKDFSMAHTCSRLPLLRLKVIQCELKSFIYDLVKYSSNQLFVIYETNNRKIVELYETEDLDTILLLESAFAYVINK